MTIVIITHDSAVAERCQRRVIMADGNLIGSTASFRSLRMGKYSFFPDLTDLFDNQYLCTGQKSVQVVMLSLFLR